jgi:hypothetical protein
MNLKSPRLLFCSVKLFGSKGGTARGSIVRLLYSTVKASMALKRKAAGSQALAGAKKAKAAIEYAAATQPSIPEKTDLQKLLSSLEEHHKKDPSTNANVVHWFRSDLRLEDNRALHAASQKAKANGKSLIALYIVSPQVRR